MATVLRFVDYEYSVTGGVSGNVLLNVNDGTNYCVAGFEFPPPEPRIEWADPAHIDGRSVSRFKYENRELTMMLQVYGTTKEDLADNIQALWHQLRADEIYLEWCPDNWTDSVFFDVLSPPIEVDSSDWFDFSIRDARNINVLANLSVIMEAKPFARGAEETLWVSHNILPNYGFDDWTGLNLDDWTITTAGGGTVTQDNANQIERAACVDLSTPGGGAATAQIETTNYIAVDATRHHQIRIYTYKNAGTTAFDVDVLCYSAAPALLGTLNMLVGDDVAGAWEDPVEKSGTTGVIHPITEGDPFSFPAGTTQVKIQFRNDSAVASQMFIDMGVFSDSEYFTKASTVGGNDTNRVECPFSIAIPADDIKGDVPAPARLWLDQLFCYPAPKTSQPFAWVYYGQRDDYDFHAYVLKPQGGAVTQLADRVDQYYSTYALGPTTVTFETGMMITDLSRGRYLPILSVNYQLATPNYCDFHLEARIQETSTPVTLVDWQDITNVARWETGVGIAWWHQNGYGTPGSPPYFEAWQVIDVPFRDIPEWADDSTIEMQFRVVCDDAGVYSNVAIDYLALIPIEVGFAHGHFTGNPQEYLTIDGLARDVYASPDVDREYSFLMPRDEWVGELDVQVNPIEGTNACFIGTVPGLAALFGGSVVYTLDTRYKYCPLYILTSEE